jgi:hypothetical protein
MNTDYSELPEAIAERLDAVRYYHGVSGRLAHDYVEQT